MDNATSRTPRDLETREATQRKAAWKPPSLLPNPAPEKGYKFRWIRTSAFGVDDNKNVSSRLREGWEPVKAKDHPEMKITSDRDSHFPDGIEVGGLLLCKTSAENVEARNSYYGQRAQKQLESVDWTYLRANDPRMPLMKPERRTRTTTGNPNTQTDGE